MWMYIYLLNMRFRGKQARGIELAQQKPRVGQHWTRGGGGRTFTETPAKIGNELNVEFKPSFGFIILFAKVFL